MTIETDVVCSAMRVVVSGAGGQTGQLVFRKMLQRPNEFKPIGLVRTDESRKALLESDSTIPEECVVVCDITDPTSLEEKISSSSSSQEPFDAMVIGTSAKPKPTGEMNEETGRPVFGFPSGQPEEVDWIGQKNQIDFALKQKNDCHVVICSSMGGTNPDHPLNNLGRTINDEDGTTEGGNILRWKRKAEMYLIDSGLPYTIVHPGGLLNEDGGKREIVIGVDDNFEGTGTDNQSIPRDDVAEVIVQSLLNKKYINRSFDIRTKPEGEGTVTTDFDELIDRIDGKNCDYTLGVAGV